MAHRTKRPTNVHADRNVSAIVQQVLAKDYSGAAMALQALTSNPKVLRSSLAIYNSVVHSCAKSGDPAGAGWVLEQMVAAGLVLNVVTFNSTIDASAQLGDVQTAESWVERMQDFNIAPNAITYNTVIKACARAGELVQAEKWFNAMRSAGFSPCIVTFTTIIGALAKSANVDKAEELFGRMHECNVKPDAVIFNSLIHACAQAIMPDKAEGWAQQMVQQGFKADEKTFNSLINAWARVADVPQAERWLQRMDQAGVTADVITFGSLLHACAKVGDVERAQMWIEEMQRRGIKPNIICLNTVVHACAQAGDAQRAEFWIEHVSKVGNPNAVSFNGVMEANAKAGDFQRVGYWLSRMVSNGTVVDGITQAMLQRWRGEICQCPHHAAIQWSYFAIIIAYIACGKSKNADVWIARMSRARNTWNRALLDRSVQIARTSGAAAGLEELEKHFSNQNQNQNQRNVRQKVQIPLTGSAQQIPSSQSAGPQARGLMSGNRASAPAAQVPQQQPMHQPMMAASQGHLSAPPGLEPAGDYRLPPSQSLRRNLPRLQIPPKQADVVESQLQQQSQQPLQQLQPQQPQQQQHQQQSQCAWPAVDAAEAATPKFSDFSAKGFAVNDYSQANGDSVMSQLQLLRGLPIVDSLVEAATPKFSDFSAKGFAVNDYSQAMYPQCGSDKLPDKTCFVAQVSGGGYANADCPTPRGHAPTTPWGATAAPNAGFGFYHSTSLYFSDEDTSDAFASPMPGANVTVFSV